jgi:hypothetical protein
LVPGHGNGTRELDAKTAAGILEAIATPPMAAPEPTAYVILEDFGTCTNRLERIDLRTGGNTTIASYNGTPGSLVSTWDGALFFGSGSSPVRFLPWNATQGFPSVDFSPQNVKAALGEQDAAQVVFLSGPDDGAGNDSVVTSFGIYITPEAKYPKWWCVDGTLCNVPLAYPGTFVAGFKDTNFLLLVTESPADHAFHSQFIDLYHREEQVNRTMPGPGRPYAAATAGPAGVAFLEGGGFCFEPMAALTANYGLGGCENLGWPGVSAGDAFDPSVVPPFAWGPGPTNATVFDGFHAWTVNLVGNASWHPYSSQSASLTGLATGPSPVHALRKVIVPGFGALPALAAALSALVLKRRRTIAHQ